MRFFIGRLTFVLLVVSVACSTRKDEGTSTKASTNKEVTQMIYVGTYTQQEPHVNGQAEGIYLVASDTTSGALELKSTVLEDIVNPTFLAVSSDQQNLYAISEIGEGQIYAFQINADHSLTLLNQLPTGAPAACHVDLDETGRYVFAANYMGGVVNMYERGKKGQLREADKVTLEGSGPHPRQEGPHAHGVVISPDNKYLYVPDLGSDKVWIFMVDEVNSKLIPNDPAFVKIQDAAGPRHLAFHPSGQYAYLINELDNTVNVLQYEATDGSLTTIQSISTLAPDFSGESTTAEIAVHPSGRFVYGSNRGDDSVAAFKVNQGNGMLELVSVTSTAGKTPRFIGISPDGQWLYAANQDTDTIVTFKIDQAGGGLTQSEHTLAIKTPVCMAFTAP